LPLYEFYCSSCRHKFERLCSYGVSVYACPQCGGESKKVFSTFRSGRSSSGGGRASGGCGG
jgi:putative FmdB family regulatory protein